MCQKEGNFTGLIACASERDSQCCGHVLLVNQKKLNKDYSLQLGLVGNWGCTHIVEHWAYSMPQLTGTRNQ